MNAAGNTHGGRRLSWRNPFAVLAASATLTGLMVLYGIWRERREQQEERELEARPGEVSEDSYNRIKRGMSRAKVEHLLGGPSHVYKGQSVHMADGRWVRKGDTNHPWPMIMAEQEWNGTDCVVYVQYDDDGKVMRKSCCVRVPGYEPPTITIRPVPKLHPPPIAPEEAC